MKLWLEVVRSLSQPLFWHERSTSLMISCGIFLVLFSGLWTAQTASAQSSADALTSTAFQGAMVGQEIFNQKCTGCHSIGGGKLVGPDLKDVASRRDSQWIKSFLLDPTGMLASDPVAQQLLKENNNVSMPNLSLTAVQADQLIEFLNDPGAFTITQVTAVPGAAGDPVAGKNLFTGELAFSRGGPPCLACHSVSGTGSLGGGGLGPDLTHVFQRLGNPGLSAALKTIAFPTMVGPFKNRALTSIEQSNLVAFLKLADQQQDPVSEVAPGALNLNVLLVFGIGLAVAGLLFGILWFFWVRLKKSYTSRLRVRKVYPAEKKAAS